MTHFMPSADAVPVYDHGDVPEWHVAAPQGHQDGFCEPIAGFLYLLTGWVGQDHEAVSLHDLAWGAGGEEEEKNNGYGVHTNLQWFTSQRVSAKTEHTPQGVQPPLRYIPREIPS